MFGSLGVHSLRGLRGVLGTLGVFAHTGLASSPCSLRSLHAARRRRAHLVAARKVDGRDLDVGDVRGPVTGHGRPVSTETSDHAGSTRGGLDAGGATNLSRSEERERDAGEDQSRENSDRGAERGNDEEERDAGPDTEVDADGRRPVSLSVYASRMPMDGR